MYIVAIGTIGDAVMIKKPSTCARLTVFPVSFFVSFVFVLIVQCYG